MPRSLALAGLIIAVALAVVAAFAAYNATAAARADVQPAAPGSPGKDASMINQPAPIEGGDLRMAESFPPQYFLHVKYGLPSGCARPGGYDIDRNNTTIAVTVSILLPSDPNTACTMIYGVGEHNIPLGSNFRSGETYTITLNGQPVTSFVVP